MIPKILSALTRNVATSFLIKPQPRVGVLNLLSNISKPNSSIKFFSLVHQQSPQCSSTLITKCLSKNFLKPKQIISSEQIRTVVKFNLVNGRRRTVKSVVNRFFRLHWGIWIRTIAGRNSKLWKKNLKRRIRLRQHVFCNAKQSRKLDIMVSKYWRKPKYYIEDPYAPYHNREEFFITKRKPWRPEGVDYE